MVKTQARKYIDNQNFNFLTKYLHSVRYKNLLKVAKPLHKKLGRRLKVADIGCGYCKAYEILNESIEIDYIGIDPRVDFSEVALELYNQQKNFRYVVGNAERHTKEFMDADLIVALECFEHIPGMILLNLLSTFSKMNKTHFFITVPNEVGPILGVKNIGSFLMGYNRWREYTWAETLRASTFNLNKLPPHEDGHKGFDWRWLEHSLRLNLSVEYRLGSPFTWMPSLLSPSIAFLCSDKKAK